MQVILSEFSLLYFVEDRMYAIPIQSLFGISVVEHFQNLQVAGP